jgi:hypothetical protein
MGIIKGRARIWLIAISVVIALTNGALGQENSIQRPPDTTFRLMEDYPMKSPYFGPALPFLFTPAKSDLEISAFLRQTLIQENAPGQPLEQNLTTLQWMWRGEVSRGDENQTLREIVGAVELGAVSYFAYRHLKRYGLK